MIESADLKTQAKKLLRPSSGLDDLLINFLETQDENTDKEWYCTPRNMANGVLGDFKSHLEYLAK